ncbi:hypothetical protein [Nostoc sp. LEGE 12450]|uniref:hypothetical protein n=1 Tax=Nostoc sp. LEGE 12450 TaxID=1828643 RepID=UPI00187E1E51|nr:hypothetical protein [Nostoc sp. LEGE 12450]MBE8990795.1 hypothetical protein [Nostoc sp. LEGE 12450]
MSTAKQATTSGQTSHTAKTRFGRLNGKSNKPLQAVKLHTPAPHADATPGIILIIAIAYQNYKRKDAQISRLSVLLKI